MRSACFLLVPTPPFHSFDLNTKEVPPILGIVFLLTQERGLSGERVWLTKGSKKAERKRKRGAYTTILLLPSCPQPPITQGRGEGRGSPQILCIPTTFLSCQLAPWLTVNKGASPSSPPPTAEVSPQGRPLLSAPSAGAPIWQQPTRPQAGSKPSPPWIFS